jgi:hypothetical protein
MNERDIAAKFIEDKLKEGLPDIPIANEPGTGALFIHGVGIPRELAGPNLSEQCTIYTLGPDGLYRRSEHSDMPAFLSIYPQSEEGK